jgi:hypothetical protein
LASNEEARYPLPTPVASEDLAYWYLRLNGFLTIPNFVVHPDIGAEQRTDVDVLGVRFPHRRELLLRPMADDKPFVDVRDRAYLVLAEVKRGQCRRNGPWTDADSENMQLPPHSTKPALSRTRSTTFRSFALVSERASNWGSTTQQSRKSFGLRFSASYSKGLRATGTRRPLTRSGTKLGLASSNSRMRRELLTPSSGTCQSNEPRAVCRACSVLRTLLQAMPCTGMTSTP